MLWSRLTPRDRRVLDLVAEHRVLTTWQLLALAFPSEARAQRRLRELAELGVLFRTQPHRAAGGSQPYHYLLGYQGAELLAGQHGTTPPRPAVHRQRITRILESPKLRHLLGSNQFFADLTAYAPGPHRTGSRTPDGLQTWHSEEWVRDHYALRVIPDGYGLWRERGQLLGFFLEHDTGTETLRQVADKMDGYAEPPHNGLALPGMLLFWVPSHRRENGLRRALAAKQSHVPAATASRDHVDPRGPAGQIWSVVHADPNRTRRVQLGDLAAVIGGTEPDGTPTVLISPPPPSFEDDPTDTYWDYPADEAGLAVDDDDDLGADDPPMVPVGPEPVARSFRFRPRRSI